MVKITVNDKVKVESPYNPDFPAEAKKLGGKWNSRQKVWEFDPRDEGRVRDLCKAIYGYDGNGDDESVDLVTVRLTEPLMQEQTYWRFGRQIAQRPSRDWSVKLGEGVIVVSGEFKRRGGSRNYPKIHDYIREAEGLVLEVRDVPRSLVEQDDGDDIEIIEEKPATESPLARFSDDELITELQARGYEVAK
jgi:hypothetical protein